MIYPWQQTQWQSVWYSKQENRLPHAILLTGLSGTGKAHFANALTQALLCHQVDVNGRSCTTCHACRLLAGRVHPNVVWVEPEKIGAAIKVDQIREMNEFVQQSSMHNGYRIVVINPANNLNINAANALLKTLEEPASDAIIVLVAEQSERLPATIVSRCRRIVFPRPEKELALAWLREQLPEPTVDPALLLNIANGAPLTALRLLQDEVLPVRQTMFALLSSTDLNPIKAAAALSDHEPLVIIDFMLSWLTDLLQLQLQVEPTLMVNQDFVATLSALKNRIEVSHTISLLDYLQQVRRQLGTGINLNKQLLIESIFIKWSDQHVSR